MSRDLAVFAALSVLVGIAVSTHLTTLFGLANRKPRWPALVAFFVPPAAPFFAARAGMWVRAILGVVSLIGYGVVRLAFPS